MSKYSEKKETKTSCRVCGEHGTRMYVRIVDRQPNFVCSKHREVKSSEEFK